MTLIDFNSQSKEFAFKEVFNCCGSTSWATQVVSNRPFSTVEKLKLVSDEIWKNISVEDILEAFTHHPKIGDKKSLEKKFASTSNWATNEQSGVDKAEINILEELAKGNLEYENKFGFIFIVCATGKTADEMLKLLNERLPNSIDEEIRIAALEQNKITHLRLDKLFI